MSPDRQLAYIHLLRRVVPEAIRLAAVAAWLAACSDPAAPAELKVTAVDPTNGQIGVVGAELPLPLSVRIESDGAPRAGVTVEWKTSAGSILPARAVSDAAGLASAIWTLDTRIGAKTATSSVEGASGSPLVFNATGRAPVVRARPMSPGDGQTGVVGTTLPLPLRVQVMSEGAVKAGAAVHWHADAGSVSPEASTTDADGIAVAEWTLGTVVGSGKVEVTVDEASSPAMFFTATALPGPAVGIAVFGDAALKLPANHAPGYGLAARVRDQYGNAVPGQAVTWTVQEGPVGLIEIDGTTDVDGLSTAELDPTGEVGQAVVRAALADRAQSAEFDLTITAPTLDVRLSANGTLSFVSAQNGSSPAVDTIPAGQTVTWILQFDYDPHAIESVGSPGFVGGTFPYAYPSLVTVTFATPGTYHYTDPYVEGSAGTLVVQ